MPNSARGTWKNKADFVLALISYGVGLGNVWRFPFLAYSSGGGAFLIPFIASSVVVGIPYALLEVSLGQWMKEGGIGAWDLTPIFKGIGFANLILVFFGNVYYEIILAWSLRYLFDSFTTDLPWKYCSNSWNSPCCSERLLQGSVPDSNEKSQSLKPSNIIYSNITKNKPLVISQNVTLVVTNCSKLVDPITEYWERNVLGISKSIEDVGSIKLDLFLCLLIAWIIVYLSIFRGMKNSQVVVYITAVLPYVFLFILLGRALYLPGSLEGIKYYLKPDWSKLTNFSVWSDAGTQVFYAYGIGISALVALGSYNKFHHNSYRDVLIFTIINTFTSLLSGFVVFSVLGYMSHVQNVSIDKVADEGPGLAFIVYPQALSLMPFSPIWSIMFFFMLFLLGLGTQLVATEAITTAIIDEYYPYIKPYFDFKYTKELLSAVNVFISFVCGIPMITNGGMYVFQIFDYYAASRTLLFVGLFEIIAISYFYGIRRYCDNLAKMYRFKIGYWLRFMWVFATPLFTLVLIIFTVMTYENLTYNRTYKYPPWALRFGWLLSISSIICIPLYALYRFIRTGGSVNERFDKLRISRIKSHQIGLTINEVDALRFKAGEAAGEQNEKISAQSEQLLTRENESNLENINVALIDSCSTNSVATDAAAGVALSPDYLHNKGERNLTPAFNKKEQRSNKGGHHTAHCNNHASSSANNSTASEDDNALSFANSQTIIKP